MNDASAMTTAVLRLGEADTRGPLSVFPVFGPPAALAYVSLAEAVALGAAVRELATGASVGDVLVHNPLDVGVLLYEGEEITGAQQDRTFDRSVLVPAGSDVEVPVSCVEAGRWDGGRHGEPFSSSPRAAFPELRRAKSRAARTSGAGHADQGEVWALVDAKAERHGTRSETGAMGDVFDARRSAVDSLGAGVVRRDGQIGAVAVIGGRLCVADVVGRADVFAALHAPLVAGYALDAAEHATPDELRALDRGDALDAAAHATSHELPAIDRREIERFLAAVLGAACPADRVGIGVGAHGRFATAAAEGARLWHGDELVALTAFALERPSGRVRRPSRRR